MRYFDEDIDTEEDDLPQVEDRVMLVCLNAMGWKDAAQTIIEKGGDLDFSSNARRVDHYDPDRLPTLEDASGTEQEQVPGGYEVLVLRRAYLNENGNAVDSEVVPLSFSDPQPFFDRSALQSLDSNLPKLMRAMESEEVLEQRLGQSAEEAPQRRPRM